MGGQVDWSALPLLCELFGINDVEQFIVEVLVVRDFMTRQHGNRG